MNKVIKIIITTINNIRYVLKMDQQKIYDLEAFDLTHTSILHNVYIGKIQKIDTTLQAAFVEFSKGEVGFLPLSDGLEAYPNLKGGCEILIQISKEAIKSKAPLLTTKITLNGNYCVAILNHSPNSTIMYSKKISSSIKSDLSLFIEKNIEFSNLDFIIRSSCRDKSSWNHLLTEIGKFNHILSTVNTNKDTRTCYSCLYHHPILLDTIIGMREPFKNCPDYYEILTDDALLYQNLLEVDHSLNISLYNDSSYSLALLYGIRSKILELLKSRVWLKSGAYLVIEPTEALTVIDVNTGKIKSIKNNQEIIYNVNIEAALEIASQIRLRNISGIIIIDFINMNSTSLEKELIKTMKEYVFDDKSLTTVIDITQLGLMQITRKKEKKSLKQIIGEHSL